jgi:hypothetical protein
LWRCSRVSCLRRRRGVQSRGEAHRMSARYPRLVVQQLQRQPGTRGGGQRRGTGGVSIGPCALLWPGPPNYPNANRHAPQRRRQLRHLVTAHRLGSMNQQRVHIQGLVQGFAAERHLKRGRRRNGACTSEPGKEQHRAPLRRAAGRAGASRDAGQGRRPEGEQVHGQRRGGTWPATVQCHPAASRLAAVALALPPPEAPTAWGVFSLGRRLRVGLCLWWEGVRSVRRGALPQIVGG